MIRTIVRKVLLFEGAREAVSPSFAPTFADACGLNMPVLALWQKDEYRPATVNYIEEIGENGQTVWWLEWEHNHLLCQATHSGYYQTSLAGSRAQFCSRDPVTQIKDRRTEKLCISTASSRSAKSGDDSGDSGEVTWAIVLIVVFVGGMILLGAIHFCSKSELETEMMQIPRAVDGDEGQQKWVRRKVKRGRSFSWGSNVSRSFTNLGSIFKHGRPKSAVIAPEIQRQRIAEKCGEQVQSGKKITNASLSSASANDIFTNASLQQMSSASTTTEKNDTVQIDFKVAAKYQI